MSGIFVFQSAFPPGTEPGTIFNPLYVFLRFKKTLNLRKKGRLVSFNLETLGTLSRSFHHVVLQFVLHVVI